MFLVSTLLLLLAAVRRTPCQRFPVPRTPLAFHTLFSKRSCGALSQQTAACRAPRCWHCLGVVWRQNLQAPWERRHDIEGRDTTPPPRIKPTGAAAVNCSQVPAEARRTTGKCNTHTMRDTAGVAAVLSTHKAGTRGTREQMSIGVGGLHVQYDVQYIQRNQQNQQKQVGYPEKHSNKPCYAKKGRREKSDWKGKRCCYKPSRTERIAAPMLTSQSALEPPSGRLAARPTEPDDDEDDDDGAPARTFSPVG